MNKHGFCLNKNVVLVNGAKRAALYNLGSGDVFSIDERAKLLLTGCEKGLSLAEIFSKESNLFEAESISYLDQLCASDLGKYTSFCEGNTNEEVLFKPVPILEFIWLEVSSGCNLQCIHCYAKSAPSSIGTEKMGVADWCKVIKESRALGCERLQFIGGEPLLLGDKLIELIEFSTKEGFSFVEVFTNGTLLDEKMVAAFLANNVRVAISFYGEKESVHDSITLSRGSHARTLDAIKKILDYGIELRVSIIGMLQNEDESIATSDFLKSLGVKNIQFDIVRPSGRGGSVEVASEKLQKQLWLRAPNFPACRTNTFARRRKGHSCFLTKVCVGADGTIYPCIMERSLSYGNVLEQSLASVLSEDSTIQIRELSKDKIDVCKDCEYRYACHDCRPRALAGMDLPFNAKPRECLYDPYSGLWNSDSIE